MRGPLGGFSLRRVVPPSAVSPAAGLVSPRRGRLGYGRGGGGRSRARPRANHPLRPSCPRRKLLGEDGLHGGQTHPRLAGAPVPVHPGAGGRTRPAGSLDDPGVEWGWTTSGPVNRSCGGPSPTSPGCSRRWTAGAGPRPATGGRGRVRPRVVDGTGPPERGTSGGVVGSWAHPEPAHRPCADRRPPTGHGHPTPPAEGGTTRRRRKPAAGVAHAPQRPTCTAASRGRRSRQPCRTRSGVSCRCVTGPTQSQAIGSTGEGIPSRSARNSLR